MPKDMFKKFKLGDDRTNQENGFKIFLAILTSAVSVEVSEKFLKPKKASKCADIFLQQGIRSAVDTRPVRLGACNKVFESSRPARAPSLHPSSS